MALASVSPTFLARNTGPLSVQRTSAISGSVTLMSTRWPTFSVRPSAEYLTMRCTDDPGTPSSMVRRPLTNRSPAHPECTRGLTATTVRLAARWSPRQAVTAVVPVSFPVTVRPAPASATDVSPICSVTPSASERVASS